MVSKHMIFLVCILLTNLVSMISVADSAAQTSAPAVDLNLPDGFQAELVYDVPAEQGSWVSLTTDPKGRLIASDQYGRLYRITLQPAVSVEPIELKIGRAQGLLCAFDCLYVVANAGEGLPAGLFRVTDKDGDDQYDNVELLRKFEGGGEHGPHAVILSPDGKSLYVCAGNHTNLPAPESSRLPQVWAEDQVLPRLPDANGHATGRMAPGGWICKTDPDGKQFELISSGYRNEYDIAFDPNGELFTFDADMEWDVGLPWYRPTRVCHAVSGSEFGWRYGTGKWPSYYPDSLPAAVDIGPGSPTGIVFGTGAKFPAKFQNSLFISDWSYGIIYAVQLENQGASFGGKKEVFCSAPALPVTDLVIHPTDGAMYFLIGGRRSKSGLYRVKYTGSESVEPASYLPVTEEAKLRHQLEALQHRFEDVAASTAAIDTAWPNLKHADRFVRYAARIVIENQDTKLWTEKAISEKDPQTALEAIMALIRHNDSSRQEEIVFAMGQVNWETLTTEQRLHALRNLGLVLTRLGQPSEETQKRIASLDVAFPSGNEVVDRELVRLLVAAGSDKIVGKAIEVLGKSGSQHQQIFYALALSSAKKGWSESSRQAFFEWFIEAGKLQGGNSFGGYLKNIRAQAIESMAPEERKAFQAMIDSQPPPADPYADLAARKVVKKWTLEDLLPIEEAEFEKRDIARGKELFAIASCYKCHRVNGLGGIVGPDLTPAGHRFNTKDLVETLIDPSKEVSDQYQATVFLMEDGRTITGKVVNLNGNKVRQLSF